MINPNTAAVVNIFRSSWNYFTMYPCMLFLKHYTIVYLGYVRKVDQGSYSSVAQYVFLALDCEGFDGIILQQLSECFAILS